MRILHIQIPEFYLTIERDRRNVAEESDVAIHFPESPGFVVTCSSSALEAGVRHRLPLEKARAIRPGCIFIPADFQLYAQISEQLNMRIREQYPFTEQLDFYEWFCDLSDEDDEADPFQPLLLSRLCDRYPFRPAFSVSTNKFLAKLGNETGRSFEGGQADAQLRDVPIDHFWGIPKKWIAALRLMGAETIGDVGRLDPEALEQKFPRVGRRLLQLGLGEDDHEVSPFAKPSRLSLAATLRPTGSGGMPVKFLTEMAEALSGKLVKGGHSGFALRLEISAGGRTWSQRYRFLLPTVRASSILVGATSMFKKIHALLPPDEAFQVTLSVDDIVYDRDRYQMHGAPRTDLEVMEE